MIRYANLSGARIDYANLSNAALIGADFSRANLYGSSFNGADLSESNLSGVNLSGADLTSSNLSDANLSDANLSGADLSYSNLTGANITGQTLLELLYVIQKHLGELTIQDVNFSSKYLKVQILSDVGGTYNIYKAEFNEPPPVPFKVSIYMRGIVYIYLQ